MYRYRAALHCVTSRCFSHLYKGHRSAAAMPRAAEGGRNKGREELESNAWRYANDESLDEGEEAWAVGERTSVEALLQESVPAEIYAGTESLRDLLTSLDPPAENHALDEFITWSANEAASLISAIPLSRLLRTLSHRNRPAAYANRC